MHAGQTYNVTQRVVSHQWGVRLDKLLIAAVEVNALYT